MIGTPAPFYQRIEALAYRDRLTRFAGGIIGPYWAQITPLIWIGFLVILFGVLQRLPPIHAHAGIFVATGVLPYILFRQSVTSLARSVIANRHMRYVGQIRNVDILFGTACVEGWNIVFTSALIFGLLSFFGFAQPPDDLQRTVAALALLFLLSASAGHVIAVIGLLSDSWARIFPLALRPFFWISGVFYTATELPLAVQQLLWWNPLFHITEAMREGYFDAYQSPTFDPIYPLLCACGLFLSAIVIERYCLTLLHQRYRI